MTEPFTRPDIAAIKVRAEKATQPWQQGCNTDNEPDRHHVCQVLPNRRLRSVLMGVSIDDVAFAAHSRADVPALIAYAERLEQLLMLHGYHSAECQRWCPARNDEPERPCTCGWSAIREALESVKGR